jgi:succinate dehydrogenase / fumarate reductase, membrane anchor subunit
MVSHTKGYRTPYARVRGRGGMSGTSTFWGQRVSAVLAIPLTIAAIVVVLAVLGKDYQSTVAVLGSPLAAIPMLLFVGLSAYHMWIGVQEILTDYVHGEKLLLVLLMGNTLFSLAIFFAVGFAVLKLAFGM